MSEHSAPQGLRDAIGRGWFYGHTRDEATASIEKTIMEFFRSLPVEQRMEAMGMVQYDDSCRNDGHGGHWHEA